MAGWCLLTHSPLSVPPSQREATRGHGSHSPQGAGGPGVLISQPAFLNGGVGGGERRHRHLGRRTLRGKSASLHRTHGAVCGVGAGGVKGAGDSFGCQCGAGAFNLNSVARL